MYVLVLEHGKRYVWDNDDKDEYQIKNYYDTVPEFKEYVDKYAAKHHITVEEALTHALVKSYLEFYLYNKRFS